MRVQGLTAGQQSENKRWDLLFCQSPGVIITQGLKKMHFPGNLVTFPTICNVFLCDKSQNFPLNCQIFYESHYWLTLFPRHDHTGWASNILSARLKYTGYPSNMTPLKMGKTIHLIFYSHSQLELCFFCIFISRIYLSKIFIWHHFIGFIWIITPLMKINVSIQETKIITKHSSRVHSICVHASRNTWCTRALNTHLPHVITERAIHLSKQWNFLLTC